VHYGRWLQLYSFNVTDKSVHVFQPTHVVHILYIDDLETLTNDLIYLRILQSDYPICFSYILAAFKYLCNQNDKYR